MIEMVPDAVWTAASGVVAAIVSGMIAVRRARDSILSAERADRTEFQHGLMEELNRLRDLISNCDRVRAEQSRTIAEQTGEITLLKGQIGLLHERFGQQPRSQWPSE